MSAKTAKVWRLVSRPVGEDFENCLSLKEEPIPEVKDGQALFRTVFLSLDPTNRIWMSDADQYMEPVRIGDPMRGLVLAKVEESKNASFPVGSYVTGVSGWQTHTVSDGSGLNPIVKNPKIDLDAYLSIISVIIGCTAYCGLLDIGKPKEGETLVVSAAAGAVGSVVGQIGKLKGLRVVGLAGSDDKCAWLKKDLGFDEVINYKTTDLETGLKAACPKGIDIYFENVGGKTLDAVLKQVNNFARIPVCGLISSYNAKTPVPGPYNFHMVLMRRIKIQGFIVLDFAARFGEALKQLEQWVLDGKLKYRSDIVDGIETAPKALNKLFDGSNIGKLLVRVGSD